MVILEERERAIARGAPILCEILGYGESCDANHMSTPEPAGMRSAILRALEDAKLPPSAVDYICAHATGTVLGDLAEAAATFEVFGGNVPVASLKGNFGHMLAACGTTELIACILGMRDGIVPPTTNLVDPDVAPILLPTQPLQREQRVIMPNNFAFGGINASLVIGRG